MNWPTIILATSLLLLVYTWLGYPATLWLLRSALAARTIRERCAPSFSIIVAAYNEAAHIASKLQNCLDLEYPSERLQIIVASDGSTDATDAIAQQFAARDTRVRLVRCQGRAGKSAAQNLAVECATGDVLLFTDAETKARPDLLRLIAEDFADPRVGLVAPVARFGRFEDAVSLGQGSYWRYELFLRQLESDIGILATASGAALAVRRKLYRPLPPQYGDDCLIPLDVCRQGFRVLQDPRAMVTDEMPHSIEGELRARIRMTARNWSGILSRPAVLNPFRFPGVAWGLISHKFSRWLTPFLLAMALIINCWMAWHGELLSLFALQMFFYVAATIGWRRTHGPRCEPVFAYPFAFCLANLGFLLGVLKSLRGQSIVAYKGTPAV